MKAHYTSLKYFFFFFFSHANEIIFKAVLNSSKNTHLGSFADSLVWQITMQRIRGTTKLCKRRNG